MFGRKPKPPPLPPLTPPGANPPAVPPPLPPTVMAGPPPIPPQPRAYHRAFTHEAMVDFYTSQHRGRFLASLATKQGEELLRAGWQGLARLHGVAVVPVHELQVSAFRHESCLCGFFVFPKALYPKEAIAGLVIAGPAEKWPPADLANLPARYFVLERTSNPLTVIKEHTARGFVEIGVGPALGQDLRDFVETVFGVVFGRKTPSAQEAARRLLILQYLVVYSQASQYGKALHALPELNAEAKGDLHSIMGGLFSETLRKEELWQYVSDKEKAFFASPAQNLSQQDVLNAFWRKEAVHTLAWALGLTSTLSPYDVEAPAKSAIDLGTGGAMAFIAGSQLRAPKEIEKARDVAELWHWRSRTRELQEQKHAFEPGEALTKAGVRTYADIIRLSAERAAREGDIPPCIGNDYPAFGKAYGELSAEQWATVRSISIERHFTLNWLCGYAPGNDWERTPTHT